MNSKGTQQYLYMYSFSPKLLSHPSCRMILSRVSCAISRSLLVTHFKYSRKYMSIPNSLPSSHPSPWQLGVLGRSFISTIIERSSWKELCYHHERKNTIQISSTDSKEKKRARERERNGELLISENKMLCKKRNITIAYFVDQV